MKHTVAVAVRFNPQDRSNDLNEKQMKLHTFFRAPYERESGSLIASAHANDWNSGITANLDALNTASSS
jgi:hypothetical protein